MKRLLAVLITLVLLIAMMGIETLRDYPLEMLAYAVFISWLVTAALEQDDESDYMKELQRKWRREERKTKRQERKDKRRERKEREEEERRRNTPIKNPPNCKQKDFEDIVIAQTKKIKRISEVKISGTDVHCTVESNTGLTQWNFSIDFNDYGNLLGTYWFTTTNENSLIPEITADRIQKALREVFCEP